MTGKLAYALGSLSQSQAARKGGGGGGAHVTTHWEAALPLCCRGQEQQLRHFVPHCSAVWTLSLEVAGYVL